MNVYKKYTCTYLHLYFFFFYLTHIFMKSFLFNKCCNFKSMTFFYFFKLPMFNKKLIEIHFPLSKIYLSKKRILSIFCIHKYNKCRRLSFSLKIWFWCDHRSSALSHLKLIIKILDEGLWQINFFEKRHIFGH